MGFNCLKTREWLPGDSLLFTGESLEGTGTHLISFSLKAVYVTMVAEEFEIYGVKINRKYIFD